MKRTRLLAPAVALSFLLLISLWTPASAQEDTYVLEYTEVFGKGSRAPVPFPHQGHVDALGEEGCGACHHVYDEDSGKLEYVEGEYASCAECHGAAKQGSTPALREALHGNCTGCHRKMIRKHETTGPVTCGECHKKK